MRSPLRKRVSIPTDPNQSLTNSTDSKPSDYPYRQLVGSLMYLSVLTRPDISYALGNVSRFMEEPKVMHETALKRILRYIAGTKNYGILYNSGGDQSLTGYSDSDYGGDIDTRKSTSGFAFCFNNGIISWNSEKQKCVSLSTTESEYVAASNATKELIWLKRMFNELLSQKSNVIEFFMDNQSAIRLIKNPEFHKRSKHIDIRYHFIRTKFEEKLFNLEYINTNEMLADIFTKALPFARFAELRKKMNVIGQQNVSEK